MRRLTLRSLLFLLALVMQTATGGMTFAGTHAGVPGVSADCALTNRAFIKQRPRMAATTVNTIACRANYAPPPPRLWRL